MTALVEDFDFLIGSWTVEHRRLDARLVGATEWTDFTGTSTCWKVLAGVGNIDEIVMPTRDCVGMTIRLFDRRARLWSLPGQAASPGAWSLQWWATSSTA